MIAVGRTGIIAAVSADGVIGIDNRIPWHYSEDLKRFKRVTLGATIIMGRLTWESIGERALPGRRNVVITSRELEGVETYPSIGEALEAVDGTVWFIGGSSIFAEAMQHADFIDLTYVPDEVETDGERVVHFPSVDESVFEAGPRLQHERDPLLQRQVFTRRRL